MFAIVKIVKLWTISNVHYSGWLAEWMRQHVPASLMATVKGQEPWEHDPLKKPVDCSCTTVFHSQNRGGLRRPTLKMLSRTMTMSQGQIMASSGTWRSQLSAGVRYAQMLSKRFTDLCPGKPQRCASCTELNKRLFRLRTVWNWCVLFFFLSLSHYLLLSNSIAIRWNAQHRLSRNWEGIPPRYFHEMVFLKFTQLLYAFLVDSKRKWPSILNDNAKTPDKSCSVEDHNTWVQSNFQKLW